MTSLEKKKVKKLRGSFAGSSLGESFRSENETEEDVTLQIKIGTKQFDFNLKDEIFYRQEAAPPAGDTMCCAFCEKTFEDDSEGVNCEFCGFLFCKGCAKKQRKFRGVNKTGVCCKICDRKFVQRQMHKKLGKTTGVVRARDSDQNSNNETIDQDYKLEAGEMGELNREVEDFEQ